MLAGAAGAAVGYAAGSSGNRGGGGYDEPYYENSSYGAPSAMVPSEPSEPPAPETRVNPHVYLRVLAFLIVVTLILAVVFFPTSYKEDYNLLPGESIRILGKHGNKINPTWHHEIKVKARASHGDGWTDYTSLFSKCPDPLNLRDRDFNTNFTFFSSHFDSFYLNKGSTVVLSWTTSKPVWFDVYKGTKDFHRGTHPIYESNKQVSSMSDFQLSSNEDDLYYFVWETSFTSVGVTGDADYHLTLTVYDTSQAKKNCSFVSASTQPTCKFEMDKFSKNCVVIDVPDTSDDPDLYQYSIHVSSRWGFYYAMFFLVPVAFYLVAAGVIFAVNKFVFPPPPAGDFLPPGETQPILSKPPDEPTQSGYPPQQPGYPPQQQPTAGYPPQQPAGYPPPQPQYPPQQGYPAQGVPYQQQPPQQQPFPTN